MLHFQLTRLWKSTLEPHTGEDPYEEPRRRLREAFLRFRNKAAILGGEIARDLPSRTVHDITHLDALWGIADIIAGQKLVLTPPEAFVLGGAFLVHDLAMSRASYPNGLDSVRNVTLWRDSVASLLRTRLGRAPIEREIERPPQDIQDRATEETIIALHAQQAEILPVAAWTAKDTNDHHYLLEDQEIRETFGPTIGRVAHSHWWSVEELPKQFAAPLGAPGWCPNAWQVDTLKIACLLRVTDAARLDERRSPSFLRVLRQPLGISDLFWQFQEHILQPCMNAGRLVYSTKRSFRIDEAPAWWICFDSLQMVDRELRQVDALLCEVRAETVRFEAKGVARVEVPERLAESIKTESWLPVDARIKVSDVASLATNIGGRQLYGEEKTVPVRELVQNATDALRARQTIEQRAKEWGYVLVAIGQDETGHWLEVEDTGLGMSTDVLTGPLLDFGLSYWGSQLMRREHPGLLGKGFQPIGQYGIGFFSVFMLGDRVRVITRRYDHAKKDTLVLDFGAGLPQRPVLRKARTDEQLADGGTCVRVWLKEPPENKDGFLGSAYGPSQTLEELCRYLFPALAVNLRVRLGNDPSKEIIAADDWKTIRGTELLKRIERAAWTDNDDACIAEAAEHNMTFLKDSGGEIVGRACVGRNERMKRGGYYGLVTVGGVRGERLRGIMGILPGAPLRATRDSARPVVSPDELARWASEQADLAAKCYRKAEDLAEIAELVRACGGDTKALPIAFGASGWLTADQLRTWASIPDMVLLTSNDDFRFLRKPSETLKPNPNVLAIGREVSSDLLSGRKGRWPEAHRLVPLNECTIQKNTLKALVIEALATAWGASVGDVLRASTFSDQDKDNQKPVGKRNKRTVTAAVDTIRKPRR